MAAHRPTIILNAVFGPIESYKDDVLTEQIIQFGAHTRPELAFLLSVVRPGDRIFDLGAHIGTFTIPLAKTIGAEGRLLAVEPEVDNFNLLRRNVLANRLEDRVILRQALVAPVRRRYAPSYVSNNSGATHFAPESGWIYRGSPMAKPVSLDQLSEQYFVPDIVKMDIEGAEMWAIDQSQVFRSQQPILYAEISDKQLQRFGASVQQLDTLLRSLGYRFFKNVGPRNAANDRFAAAELSSLMSGGAFFDVLSLPADHPRLESVPNRPLD